MFRRSFIVPTAIAAAFTAIFILADWIEINPYGFPDLENYRTGFQSGIAIFSILNRGPIDFVLNEGGWVLIFDSIYTFLGNIDDSFTAVSICIVFLTSLFVMMRTRAAWTLLFFLNPAYIEISIGQIRSGLAAGLFWTAVQVRNLPAKLALLVLACTIHTSFFLFSAIYLVYYFLKDTPIGERALASSVQIVLGASILALIPSVFREAALSTIGDQRAYQFMEYSSGIFLAIAWLSLFFSYLAFRSDPKISFEGAFYGFATFGAFFAALVGVYGARLVSIGIPALAVMSWQIHPRYRIFFIIQYLVFAFLYFTYWLV